MHLRASPRLVRKMRSIRQESAEEDEAEKEALEEEEPSTISHLSALFMALIKALHMI